MRFDFGVAVRKIDMPELRTAFHGMHEIAGHKVPIYSVNNEGKRTYIAMVDRVILLARDIEGLKAMINRWISE